MGYRTDYTLKVRDKNFNSISTNELRKIADELKEFTNYSFENSNIISLYDAKWYNAQSDMKEFSKNYPNYIFCLYGNGEEEDDIWVHYFKNGKSTGADAEIIYPDYDESKLK